MKTKLIAIAALVSLSAPAHASWLCFNNGSGCYEMLDGACGAESVQNFAAQFDMICLGSVAGADIDILSALEGASTTAGGKKKLKGLMSAAEEFSKKEMQKK